MYFLDKIQNLKYIKCTKKEKEDVSVNVRKVERKDFEDMAALAYLAWGGEFKGYITEETEREMFEFMIYYYYSVDCPYSLCIEENNKVVGFLLVDSKKEGNTLENEWLKKNLKEENTKGILGYKKYLDESKAIMKPYLNKCDVVLSLFVSNIKGGGRTLMNTLFTTLKNDGFKQVFLWTDTECDFDFYYHNKFEEIVRTKGPSLLNIKDIETMVFKRNL